MKKTTKGIGEACLEERQSQVGEQQNQLSSSINYLDDTVRTLRERLGSILRMEEPEISNAKEKTPDPQFVSLASDIRDLRSKVVSIKDMVDDMLERIEL